MHPSLTDFPGRLSSNLNGNVIFFFQPYRASTYKLFSQFWKQRTDNMSEKMISCQLQLDKTEESHVTVTLMARLLTLSCFWLFYPFQPSFSERHDPLPSLKLHSCGTAAYTA